MIRLSWFAAASFSTVSLQRPAAFAFGAPGAAFDIGGGAAATGSVQAKRRPRRSTRSRKTSRSGMTRLQLRASLAFQEFETDEVPDGHPQAERLHRPGRGRRHSDPAMDRAVGGSGNGLRRSMTATPS